MEYRKLPHGEEQLSVLGLGTSSIGAAGDKEIEATMGMALEAGINFFDMASADATPFPAYGQTIAGMREKLCFQIHFGVNYQTGKYGWTTNLDTIKRSIDWQLSALKTDYIQSLKGQGVVRHIALGSHTPGWPTKCWTSWPGCGTGPTSRNCWATLPPPRRRGTTLFWVPSPPGTRQESASTTTTASPVPPGWTWVSSTSAREQTKRSVRL